MKEKQFHELVLHETCKVYYDNDHESALHFEITAVHGGWIYRLAYMDSMVFVPDMAAHSAFIEGHMFRMEK